MEIGGIISAIVIGLIIGILGRLVLPGRQNISVILTILVGIVAALVGTALAGALDVADTDGIDWIELLLQVVLAAVGVGLLSAMRSRSRAL
ncbi:MAG TPA: GlsB/YeaQ/YmgE family stress response membrane protein [Jiangellaceae bacterium]